jgi:hypothetical protein
MRSKTKGFQDYCPRRSERIPSNDIFDVPLSNTIQYFFLTSNYLPSLFQRMKVTSYQFDPRLCKLISVKKIKSVNSRSGVSLWFPHQELQGRIGKYLIALQKRSDQIGLKCTLLKRGDS